MGDGNFLNADEITRREHNETAEAKRVLGLGFDYENGEYTVPNVDQMGSTITKEQASRDIEEKLESVETILRLILRHVEHATQQEFTIEDLEIEQ